MALTASRCVTHLLCVRFLQSHALFPRFFQRPLHQMLSPGPYYSIRREERIPWCTCATPIFFVALQMCNVYILVYLSDSLTYSRLKPGHSDAVFCVDTTNEGVVFSGSADRCRSSIALCARHHSCMRQPLFRDVHRQCPVRVSSASYPGPFGLGMRRPARVCTYSRGTRIGCRASSALPSAQLSLFRVE
jgi:hypothetical protein